MLAKAMLAKTRDKLLTQNKKTKQNEKTLTVTTWHPALKHLHQILRVKYQHI